VTMCRHGGTNLNIKTVYVVLQHLASCPIRGVMVPGVHMQYAAIRNAKRTLFIGAHDVTWNGK